MRAVPTALLIVGFGIGFGAMYAYISPKAADIARPLPQFVPQSATPAVQADPAVVSRLEGILSDDPRDFQALRELGNLRYDERNYAAAADLYGRALEVQPGDVNVRSDRGGALLQSNRVDDAIEELRTALSIDPTHPQALYILGVALFQGKNDPAGALELWTKLVESHPDLPQIDLVKRQIEEAKALTGNR